MKIVILSVGPKHDPALKAKIEEYAKRLGSWHNLEWILLPYSSHKDDMARKTESDALRAKLASRDVVVLLDERGQQLDSPGLAHKLEQWQGAQRLVFVIGGAYGVDDQLREQANFIWSFSRLVFPHQLARLLLVEQLYRGECINHSHPYHHS